jgi:hypothetical protein
VRHVKWNLWTLCFIIKKSINWLQFGTYAGPSYFIGWWATQCGFRVYITPTKRPFKLYSQRVARPPSRKANGKTPNSSETKPFNVIAPQLFRSFSQFDLWILTRARWFDLIQSRNRASKSQSPPSMVDDKLTSEIHPDNRPCLGRVLGQTNLELT